MHKNKINVNNKSNKSLEQRKYVANKKVDFMNYAP
jgi:hypothetical protein